MFIINWSGGFFTWLPKVSHDNDNDGLWYWSFTLLSIQIVIASRQFADALIIRMNKKNNG